MLPFEGHGATVEELVADLSRAFQAMERRARRLTDEGVSPGSSTRSRARTRELDSLARDFDQRLKDLNDLREALPDRPAIRRQLLAIEDTSRRFHELVRRKAQRSPRLLASAKPPPADFPDETDARRLLAAAERLLEASAPSAGAAPTRISRDLRARSHIDLPPPLPLGSGEMELELRFVETGRVETSSPLVARADMTILEWGFRFGLSPAWSARLFLPSYDVETTLNAGPVLSYSSSATDVLAGEFWWTRPGKRRWQLSLGFASLSVLRDESGRSSILTNLSANAIPLIDLARYRHQSLALRRSCGRIRPGLLLRHADLNRPIDKLDLLQMALSVEALLRRDCSASIEFGRLAPSWDRPLPFPDPDDENYLSAAVTWARGDWSTRLEGRFLDQHGEGSHRWELCVTWRP